nr:MAG TPA: hypothetical protein [Caudoviricetes sp.]
MPLFLEFRKRIKNVRLYVQIWTENKFFLFVDIQRLYVFYFKKCLIIR